MSDPPVPIEDGNIALNALFIKVDDHWISINGIQVVREHLADRLDKVLVECNSSSAVGIPSLPMLALTKPSSNIMQGAPISTENLIPPGKTLVCFK